MRFIDYSTDESGMGSAVDAIEKQANENTAGRCTYFDDSSERISTELATHSIKVEAKIRELDKVDQQLEKLKEKRRELYFQLGQLCGERQIMLENANRPNALSAIEKLGMAWTYEKEAYEINEFATLYYAQPTEEIREKRGKGEDVVELAANPLFYKPINKLIAGIKTFITKDASGVERLAGYVKRPDGFPIEAYRVVCCRLKKRTDKQVFTLREQWPFEVIKQAFENLPSTKASREAERETLGKRDRTREEKSKIVGEVLRDMPRETVTAQTVEIMERFKKKNLGTSWKTAERALTEYKQKFGARKPSSVMLS